MKRNLFFITILLLGIGTKLYYAYSLSGYLDGDPATIGLMAKDVLEGRFNVFFYGQNFNGPLEAVWLAPFIWFFGLKTITLFCGMIVLYALFLLTIYKLGSLLKDSLVGLYAMAYCAVSTYPLLHNSVFPYGYHMSILVLGNLLLILALINKNIIHWILLGLIAGLGFWNHFIIMYYLAPIAVFLFPGTRLGYKFTGLISFFVGGLPFWLHNLQTNFSSFSFRGGRPYSYYPIDIPLGQALRDFFGYHFSAVLGIQGLNITGLIVWGIFIISLVVFFIRFNKKKFLWLLLLSSIIGFSLSQRFFVISPKYCYFLPLYTVTSIFFAYLVDWLNGKIRYSGVVLLLFLLLFNMGSFAISTSEGKPSDTDRDRYHVKVGIYRYIIDFLDSNKINGVIADFFTVQGLNFMTDKRIAGAEILNGRPPTDELVQSRDRIAIFDCTGFLKTSLDVICKDYKITQVGPYGDIAYGFSQYGYYGRCIESEHWKVKTNYNKRDSMYSFDKNTDRFWSSVKHKSPGMYYELDMGRVYKVYRFIVFNISPHLNNFPASYRIKVSKDGVDWDTVQTSENPQPLFWSGPRPYWEYYNGRWEVIFKPQDARFIRIEQTDYGKWAWMINELYVYEYLGEYEPKWLGSARQLYQYLLDNHIRFVYADFWLSAKIREWSRGRIGALRVVNECYPKREHTSRLMELDEDTAIIIEKAEETDLEELLQYFDLLLDKVYFGDYICYRFKELNSWQRYFLENQRCLYWLGITMAKTNIYLYNQILASYGARSNKKQLLKFKHLCQPQIERNVVFKNGITFLGYRLFQYKGRLRISYYWKTPSTIPEGLVVFVHFTKDRKIIFQGDHPLLENYPKPIIPLKDWIYVERYWVDVPPETGPGIYKINLGLYMPDKKGRRIRIKYPGNLKSSSAEVGKVKFLPDVTSGASTGYDL